MSTYSKSVSRIFLVCLFVFTSRPFLQAKFQSESPGKLAAAQGPRQRQVEGQPAPEIMGYWEAFTMRSGGPLFVSWNLPQGTPETVFGLLSERADEVSEAAARRFLSENALLFKMSRHLDDLALIRDFDSPLGRHFVFQQYYQGVLVYDARAAVHFNRSGRVVAINNTYLPEINLPSVDPAMNLDHAIEVVRGELPEVDTSQASGDLVVYAYGASIVLAWQITVPTEGPTWEVFIDARTGRLLGVPRDINSYATGSGRVFRVNAVVATRNNSLRDNNDAAAAVPSSAYSVVTLLGLSGNGRLDGQYASSSDSKKSVFSASNSFIYDRSSDGFSETMGYYYIDYAERYIQSLGFFNVNNRQQVFSVNHLKQDNSFYSPRTKEITYGTGGVDDAEDAEVIFHEYGHSIQDNQVPGFGSTLEAGSMGEGFGDYWAGSVGAQLSGGFQDTCVADWDATSYSLKNPPCLRRLDSIKRYPQNIVGEVHADGEIWSAALWQIRSAIDPAKADRVVLQAHFLLPRGASFNQGANAIVTAAKNLAYTAAEVSTIRTILQNRGFTVTV